MLFNAGLHVPVILLVEVVGNADRLPPTHIAATYINVGVVIEFTVIVMLTGLAHKPGVGVKL